MNEINDMPKQLRYALFTPIVAVVVLALFSSQSDSLGTLSTNVQRGLMGLTVLLPALIGLGCAIWSLTLPTRRVGLGIALAILNGLIALYFAFLLSFAG